MRTPSSNQAQNEICTTALNKLHINHKSLLLKLILRTPHDCLRKTFNLDYWCNNFFLSFQLQENPNFKPTWPKCVRTILSNAYIQVFANPCKWENAMHNGWGSSLYKSILVWEAALHKTLVNSNFNSQYGLKYFACI